MSFSSIWHRPMSVRLLGSAAEVRRALIGPGLGLALAVRPAGSAEAPGQRRAVGASARSGMRSTVEAGGADPDNARRSGPVSATFTAIGALA